MKEPWVIVSAGFHSRGGQAKAVAGLAAYLARTGHMVHCVGHDFDPELANSANITIHSVRRFFGDAVGNVFLARAGRAVARRIVAAEPAARVVVNGGNCYWSDIDWVHYLHTAFSPDLRLAPRWFRIKEQFIGSWYRRRERRSIQASRSVITNSRLTTNDVVKAIGIPMERVRTVYYGADPTWAQPSNREKSSAREFFKLHPVRPIVSFVGGFGFDNRKGFDTLLEAWKVLCRSPKWDADLVLAGGGKASFNLSEWLTKEGLAERVKVIGFTDKVFELLAATDLLVSPVRYEPYGLNVQEAICRGIPALVSKIAGVAEEYPSELQNMLLTDANDPNELASKLRLWRSDIQGWKIRFQPLSEKLRSRSWDDMAREIISTVERGN